VVNVDVQERWYILPLPQGGIEDGEWAKTWIGLDFKWDNFRGRNESISLDFRILYNPFIRASYTVPRIGDKLRLFSTISIGYSRSRNQSLTAVGRTSGSNTIKAGEHNYDNYQFNSHITIGKQISGRIAPYTNVGFDYIRVSQYAEGRTVSAAGIDKYMTFGIGIRYDSRDIYEFATKGYYFETHFQRYGHLDRDINFGKFDLESQSFIPVNFNQNYYITVASRLHTSLSVGAVIPLYHHEYLGYSDDYVRGWKGTAFEGENEFTLYNEIRIPLLKPRYIKAQELPLINIMPILRKLDLRHGLYFTLFYDVGSVWYKYENVRKVRFLSGAGMGLNVILPFGYIARMDWAFRIARPVVGELGLSLSAKF
jgi:outer membrane protein assembly factor BamA